MGNQTIRWSSVIRFKALPDKPSLFFSLYSLFYSPFFFPSSSFLLLFSLTNKQLSASYFSPLQLDPDLVFPVLLVKVISALYDVTDGVIGGIADLAGLLSRRSLMLLFSCLWNSSISNITSLQLPVRPIHPLWHCWSLLAASQTVPCYDEQDLMSSSVVPHVAYRYLHLNGQGKAVFLHALTMS